MNNTCCTTPSQTLRGAEASAQREGQSVKGVSYFKPAVDVAERADAFIVKLDVPGATRDSLDIAFEQGSLTVTARVQARAAQGARPLLREYEVGDYQRTFRIGEAIDPGAIDATLASGVLTVTLPKAPSAQPRRIEVRGA